MVVVVCKRLEGRGVAMDLAQIVAGTPERRLNALLLCYVVGVRSSSF